MSINRVYNFTAGPSALPNDVVEEISSSMNGFGGMSILEISHRSAKFGAVIDEARALVRDLMRVPDGYHILFMQGGASQQFAMVPLNLMASSADYAITGTWSKKAFAEAKVIGSPKIIYSSEKFGFNSVPSAKELKKSISNGADYVHITSNNTIFGTQYAEFPDAGDVPLIADMSSDIMSREIDVSKFALIYAGAQKNLGPAGISIVIIRSDMLSRCKMNGILKIFRYGTHAEGKSMYNTPPTFAIWAMMLNLRWLKKQGGVKAIGQINVKKAKLLYDAIDESNFYACNSKVESRSMMNVTFTLPTEELAVKFADDALAEGMVGLKGHRSVGGIRASIYNAVPLAGVERLVKFMRDFERRNLR